MNYFLNFRSITKSTAAPPLRYFFISRNANLIFHLIFYIQTNSLSITHTSPLAKYIIPEVLLQVFQILFYELHESAPQQQFFSAKFDGTATFLYNNILYTVTR